MPYPISNTVLAIGQTDVIKKAVLFFEYVIPLTFSEVPQKYLPPDMAAAPQKHFANYVFLRESMLMLLHALGCSNLINELDEEFARENNMFSVTMHADLLFTRYEVLPGKEEAVNAFIVALLEENRQVPEPCFFPYKKTYPGFLKDEKISIRDYVFNHEFCCQKYPIFGLEFLSKQNSTARDSIVVPILKLPTVDTSTVSWEQIDALRDDSSSVEKFRQIIAFFLDSHSGRKAAQEEELESRVELFEEACKKHGFKTVLRV